MKPTSFALLLWVACNACSSEKLEGENCRAQSWNTDTSIRALEVVSEEEIWYAGADGTIGSTQDGGLTWNRYTLTLENGSLPSFRSIAVTKDAIHALTISSPAVLFRSDDGGNHWDSVYTEHHPDVFYDSMTFWDDQDGIAMGDAIGGCLSIIITQDGGATWSKLPCDQLPKVKDGEAAFAASNGNISVSDSSVWMVSGGKASRVFSSADRGVNWEVMDIPVLQGGEMTGMFSLHMRDENNGIAWGGDWENMEINTMNKVITNDGGKHWDSFSNESGPGYRSCVRFAPKSNGKEIWAVGIPGISRSKDGGHTWSLERDSSYYTIRFAPNGSCAWLAGNGIISRRPINS